MAPPTALPGFWIFMYRVSPFTYLIGAILSTGVANTEIRCSQMELLRLKPPTGQTCGEYLGPFMQTAGGAVYNPTDTQACEFCPLADTNAFLASVASSFDQRWRNYGIICAYVLFNVAATLVLYWVARVPRKHGWSNACKRSITRFIKTGKPDQGLDRGRA